MSNPEPNPEPNDDNLDKFKEIKEEYETKLSDKEKELSDKDKEIEELKKQLEEKNGEVDDKIDDIQQQVNDKIETSEKYQELMATVAKLEKDKAEATVDRYIQEGKLLPSQKETALEFAVAHPDKFIDLYENAKPIIDIGNRESRPVPNELTDNVLNNSFKNIHIKLKKGHITHCVSDL